MSQSEALRAALVAEARRRRERLLDREPTWRGSINRAALAAVLAVVLAYFFMTERNAQEALTLGVFAMALYVPLGYLMDRAIYRARMRRKDAATRSGGGGRAR